MTAPDGADDLDARWRGLPVPGGLLLEGERVIDWVGGPVLVALDADARRHLLVGLPDDAPAPPQVRPLRGLSVQNRRMRIRGQEGMWVDLVLTEDRGQRAFSFLAAEVLDTLAGASAGDVHLVAEVIDRWRRFWATTSEGLSAEVRLGLFGELWLLLEWLPRLTRGAIAAWRGPLGGRHDFATPTVSVEVKTTGRATGPILHRIVSLDQLDDPRTGELYLLSLRTVADPLGGHSLDSLVRRARTEAARIGQEVVAQVDDRLAAYGWSPAEEGRYAEPSRVADQALFHVADDFPRLTPRSFPEGLPSGVHDISYMLDTSACGAWLIAHSPDPASPVTRIS